MNATTLTGFLMGPSGLTYATVETLNVMTSEASQAISVQSTNAATTTRVQLSVGAFFIAVGSTAPNSDGTLSGSPGRWCCKMAAAEILSPSTTAGHDRPIGNTPRPRR